MENYNYKLLTGIVKVIKPSGKPVIGIADGQGKFMWLPTENIIAHHPPELANWQTTIFAIDPNWNIIWKEEKKWDEYKSSYPTNTKPIPQPIPPMFKNVSPAQPIPSQPPTTVLPTDPPQYPNQKRTRGINLSDTHPMKVFVAPLLEELIKELREIKKILFIAVSDLEMPTDHIDFGTKKEGKTISESEDMRVEEVIEQFGEPPEEEPEEKPNVNKDGLPDIF